MLLLDCFQLKTLCFAGIVLELRTSPKTFDLAQQREVCGKAKGRRQPPVQSLLYISFAVGSFQKQGRGGGGGGNVRGNPLARSSTLFTNRKRLGSSLVLPHLYFWCNHVCLFSFHAPNSARALTSDTP